MIARVLLAVVALAVGSVGGIALAEVHEVHAQPKAGLYFEQQVAADGIGVRRMRDVGENVVCYVAKGPTVTGEMGTRGFNIPPAISCVKVSP